MSELYQDHRDPRNECKCSEISCSAFMKPSNPAAACLQVADRGDCVGALSVKDKK